MRRVIRIAIGVMVVFFLVSQPRTSLISAFSARSLIMHG